MAKMKNLILKCQIETAQRKHYCKHNKKHIISRGELRLAITLNDGRATKIYYCKECALKMIEQAKLDLCRLESCIKL